jgi:hypothetical protein
MAEGGCMTQSTLSFDEPPTPAGRSLTAQIAAYFQANAGREIEMQELAARFGTGGWRTRVSNARKAPFHLDIRNRYWTERRADGSTYRVSVYWLAQVEQREVA